MVYTLLLFGIGLLFLIKGGNWFVDGSVEIARKLKMSELMIGATIVSAGTTLPELFVSAQGALMNNSGIAYGNAIGSIICNTAFICALNLIFRPQPINAEKLRDPVLFYLFAAMCFTLFALTGFFSRSIGVLLLFLYILYMMYNYKTVKHNYGQTRAQQGEFKKKNYLYLIFGLLLVILGANLVVNNALVIASLLNVPDSVVGLTIVALGTSLPELTTAIISIRKGHTELSIGNIVGANLFNLTIISGTAITLKPFGIPIEKTLFGINSTFILDLPLIFILMGLLTCMPFLKGRTYRWQGLTLMGIYFGYLIFQFLL